MLDAELLTQLRASGGTANSRHQTHGGAGGKLISGIGVVCQHLGFPMSLRPNSIRGHGLSKVASLRHKHHSNL